jgi:hypothetical protein
MWRSPLTSLLTEGEEMKIRSRITKLIAITMAVTTLAVVGYIGTAEAQNVRVYSGTAIVGFIPGQSLHCSMAYLNGSEEAGPVRVQAYVYDATGRLLSRTDPVELRRGQFNTYNIDRDGLPVEGEARTRRAQVRVEFQFQVDASQTLISDKDFLVTVEGVNNSSGGSYFTGTPPVSDDNFGNG